MPIDYSKRDSLQSSLQTQQKRIQDAQSKYDQATQTYKSGANRNNTVGYGPNLGTAPNQSQDDYNKAKGAYDAEKHSADVEIAALNPQIEEENKRIQTVQPFADLQQKQEMRAQQFRQAFPSILDSKLGAARTESRRKIAEGVNATRAGYNQRGLLYSGLRSGAEADVSANAENELADTAVKTNQELMDQGNELDQDVADTGLTMANISQNLAGNTNEYRQAIIDSLLNKDAQRQQAIGGLLGTGAQIAGLGLGAATR